MTLPIDLDQELDSKYFICMDHNCQYKGYNEDNICPQCYALGIALSIDELIAAPNGADVLEYIYEQMGFK